MALSFSKARWGMAALVATANLLVAQGGTPAEAQTNNKCKTQFGSFPSDPGYTGFHVHDFSSSTAPVAFTETQNHAALIIGTAFNDTLEASQTVVATVVICGKGGDDVVEGGGGPSTLRGGGGRDFLGGTIRP